MEVLTFHVNTGAEILATGCDQENIAIHFRNLKEATIFVTRGTLLVITVLSTVSIGGAGTFPTVSCAPATSSSTSNRGASLARSVTDAVNSGGSTSAEAL